MLTGREVGAGSGGAWMIRMAMLILSTASVVLGYAGAVRAAPGDLDPTFGSYGMVTTDFGAQEFAGGVAVQGDGKLVLAGWTADISGPKFALSRLNSDGTPDTTFGGGDGNVTTDFSGTNDSGYSVAIQPDGKIVVGGNTATGTENQGDFALVRYDSSGSPDNSFDNDGKATTNIYGADRLNDITLQEDGRIVAAGYASADDASPADFALARYNANGSLNTSFGVDGKVTTDFDGTRDRAYGVTVQDDGKIIAAGDSSNYPTSDALDFALARYNADGSPNIPFGNDGKVTTDFSGFVDGATDVALQSDGKVVAAGITEPGSQTDFAAARYFVGDDSTPPRVSAPSQSLGTGTTLGPSNVPVMISWSASDVQGDITRYQLQRSTDGSKTFTDIPMSGSTANTVIRRLTPGHDYRFRVRATDDNGNTSLYKYGPRFTVDAVQEDDSPITYSPGTAWASKPLSGAYGGNVEFATATGASAEIVFTGTNVAWVAPKDTNLGKADVLLDGKTVATVDLRAPAASPRRVVFAANGLAPGVNHTLKVLTLGTAGRPEVDVDAFVALR